MKGLINLLRSRDAALLDVDSADRMTVHAATLAGKPMLRRVFRGFHELSDRLDRECLSGSGLRIELGEGVAPMRDTFPDVLATDVVPGPGLDRLLNAEALDLPDNSVRAFFIQNAFHHFPHPTKFFEELERVLVPGGGAVIIDPYFGLFASFLYKRLFRSEGFDKGYPSWETPANGPMNGANQALSYLVFVRDRKLFEQSFPGLEIAKHVLLRNYLSYLMSGGLNFRQLCPDALSPLVNVAQSMLLPLDRVLALHHCFVIRKPKA